LIDVQSIIPVGTICMTLDSSPPEGWAFAQGQQLSRVEYPLLFAKWGTINGAGDGSTTFNAPDMRGEYPRGFDAGRGIDAGRLLGTQQGGVVGRHAHGGVPLYTPQGDSDRGGAGSLFSTDNLGFTAEAGATENLVRNVAMNFMFRLG
jgi:microcystin-dependent protein